IEEGGRSCTKLLCPLSLCVETNGEGKRQKRRRRTAPLSSTADDERLRASHQSLMMKDGAALILTDESRAVCLLLFCLLPFYFCLPRWVGSRAEALSVLVRVDEGFDHLGGDV